MKGTTMNEEQAVPETEVDMFPDIQEIADYNEIFRSYREYVGMCIESNEDIPTFSEFKNAA
jgi:hypothetical protein